MFVIQIGPETRENRTKVHLFNTFCVEIDSYWEHIGVTEDEAKDEFINRGSLATEIPVKFSIK